MQEGKVYALLCIKKRKNEHNRLMIKKTKTLIEVRNEILSLISKPVKIAVNRGRNKVEKYSGTVISTHPHLFVVKVENNPLVSSLCCSYKEVICGEVKIKLA
jgi:uncharacterized protein Veg